MSEWVVMSKECEEGGFYMRWSRAAEGMTRVLGMFMESKPNRSITSRLDRDGLTIVGRAKVTKVVGGPAGL